MPFVPETPFEHLTDVFVDLLAHKRRAPTSIGTNWNHGNLNWACREIGKFITPAVSVAAYRHAIENQLPDPRTVRWGEQSRRLKDPGRRIFVLEHLLPVSDMIYRLEALGERASTAEIRAIIELYDLVWILRIEDDRLNQLRYRNRRPNDPLDAYRAAGILIQH